MFTDYLEFDRTRIPEPGANSNCEWKGMQPQSARSAARPVLLTTKGAAEDDGAQRNRAGGLLRLHRHGFGFDNARLPDLYVACDSRPSLLYHNRRDGTFEDRQYLRHGAERGWTGTVGMGVAVADYDEDGYFDILKNQFQRGHAEPVPTTPKTGV